MGAVEGDMTLQALNLHTLASIRVNLLDALGPMRGSILHAWPCLRNDPVAGKSIAAGLAKTPKLKLMFLVFFLVRSTYCDPELGLALLPQVPYLIECVFR
jgi:hypothetical protein